MKFEKKDSVWAEFAEGWFAGKVLDVVGRTKIKVKFEDGEVQIVPMEDALSDEEYQKKHGKKKNAKVEKEGGDSKKKGKSSLDDDFSGADNDNESGKGKGKEADELEDMGRAELKEYIEDKELGIRVTKDMEDDDIRELIREAQGEKGGKKKKAEEEEPAPRKEVDIDDLDRDALKEYIDEHDLDITVKKSMDEDDIRAAILKAEKPEDAPERPAKGKSSEEADGAGETGDETGGSWFAVGDEQDSTYTPPKKGMFRLWIPAGEDRELTIINPKPLTYREHQVKINGDPYNFFTCLAPTGKRCPICENGGRSYIAKAFYIIDHSEYKDKKGEKKKDQLRLAIFKSQSYEILKKTVEKYFKGEDTISFGKLRLIASRSNSKKSPATGDVFVVQKRVKLDSEQVKTMDELAEEVKPLSRNELAQKVHFIEPDERDKKGNDDD